jgi:F-type H+-transporting ATPase subunit alpha
VDDVRRFESEFLDHIRHHEEGILSGIRESGSFDEGTENSVVKAVESFKKEFTASDGSSVAGNEEDAEAMDADEVDQETVKVNKPAPKK